MWSGWLFCPRLIIMYHMQGWQGLLYHQYELLHHQLQNIVGSCLELDWCDVCQCTCDVCQFTCDVCQCACSRFVEASQQCDELWLEG
jgi:hypothetical protein